MLTMDGLKAYIETATGWEVKHTTLLAVPEKRTLKQTSLTAEGLEVESHTHMDAGTLSLIAAIFPGVARPESAKAIHVEIDWERRTTSTVFYFGEEGLPTHKTVVHKQF